MVLKNDIYEVNIDMVLQNEDINNVYDLVEKDDARLIELDNVLDVNQWRLYKIDVKDGTNHDIIYLLGSPYSALDNCFILDNEKIKVLNDNYLLDIDLESMDLVEKLELLDYSTGIEIMKYIDGYLVHGERELIRINEYNDVLWVFTGKNLLISGDEGKRALKVENDIIYIEDLYGEIYCLNSMGEELK